MEELVYYNSSLAILDSISNEHKSADITCLLSCMVESENKDKEFTFENFNFISDVNLSPNNLNQIELIKNLTLKISKLYEKNYKIENFSITNYESIIIDYSTVQNINFLLITIINSFINKKDFDIKLKILLERNFESLGKIPMEYKKYLEEFETIKTIEIKISDKKNDDLIYLEHILFFYLFFETLFPYYLDMKIDFNITKINKYFFTERNPYRMIDRLIKKVGKRYEKGLIANFIISKLFNKNEKIQNLQIKILDSYVLEMSSISNNLNNFDYMTNLLQLNNLFRFECIFNCLDTLLFEKLNSILIKNISLESLSLNLFPPEIRISNFRKILITQNFINKKFFIENDSDVYLDLMNLSRCIENLNQIESHFILADDKVCKYLFYNFNYNLKNLLLILETKIKKLKYLHIFINPPTCFLFYDNYNCAIGCFIFNLFKILNNNKNHIDLVTFQIEAQNFYFDYGVFEKWNNFDLSNLKVMNFLMNLKMKNLHRQTLKNINTNFSPKIPNEFVNNLELTNILLEDFINLTQTLEKEFIFNNLIKLKIGIELCLIVDPNHFYNTIIIFFKIIFPNKLEVINFSIKNNLSLNCLFTILNNICSNNSYVKLFELNLNLETNISQEIKNYQSNTKILLNIRTSHEFKTVIKTKTETKKNIDKKPIQISSKFYLDVLKIYSKNLFSNDKIYSLIYSLKRFTTKNNNNLYTNKVKQNITLFLFSRKVKTIVIY